MEGAGASVVFDLVLSNAFSLAMVLAAFGAHELYLHVVDANGSRGRSRLARLLNRVSFEDDEIWIYETYLRLEPPHTDAEAPTRRQGPRQLTAPR